MEFLNNTKNFGLIIAIVALINIAVGVWSIVDMGFSRVTLGYVLSPLVMILAGFAIFAQTDGGIIKFAFPEGSRSKFGALTGYIFATGISHMLSLEIAGVIAGLIVLFIGWMITNDWDTIVDKIVWVLLIIIYALGTIGNVIVAISSDPIMIATGVLGALLTLMAFLYLLDPEVKKKFLR